MFANVLFVLDELVTQELFEMRADALQSRDAADHVARQVKAIQIIKDGHIERCRCCSLFLVSTDVEIVMIRAPIGQTMNQPRIAVVGEDDRLVGREDRVELPVGEAVGMFG